MEKGYFCLVLHAHLPFVRHPEYESFLEEDWLFEAITETYIPLINIFENLITDKVDFNITMSLTPPLIAMLTDPLLQTRYLTYINNLIALSTKEVERTAWQPELNPVSIMYKERFANARYVFEDKYNRNIVTAFKNFQEMGKLEIITCGATHGYLPLMETCPKAIDAQIKIAADHYEEHFDRRPRGIWLPECGYHPGVDEILKKNKISFFFTDAHGVLHAKPRPCYGVFAPVTCKSGVMAFGRDLESSKQVWSSEEGYPGDYNYRDFYRDIGYDAEYDYIRPYINADGKRKNTGIKYFKITGHTENKLPYDPQKAEEVAAVHAANFMHNRQQQIEYLSTIIDRKPLIVSPYDAELFGHWWYEGPKWIDFLIRKIACDQTTIKMISPPQYLRLYPQNQIATPSMSSWGHKGYSEVWLNEKNDWIYKHLIIATERMTEIANLLPEATSIKKRALNQAARELLLAQSSDWAFIMKTGTMVEYAVKRTKDHLTRFTKLYFDIKQESIDESWLKDIEGKDNIFPNIDYSVYR